MRISDWSSDVCSSDLDHAFLDQRIEIDDAVPEFLAEHQHRDRLDLAGLDQGQQLERLVEGAEAAGEDAHRAGAEQEVHLAQSEIVELKAQRRGNVAIRRLFVRDRKSTRLNSSH